MTVKKLSIKLSSIIILCFMFLFLGISLFLWVKTFPGIRRSFIFKASDSDVYHIEDRYLPLNPAQGKVQNYIDELLLGSISEHCNPIFSKGTRVISCFERNKTLYVNLSKDLLKADGFNTDFRFQIDLFKRNIFNNFKHIKKIEIFIDGKTPYLFSDGNLKK